MNFRVEGSTAITRDVLQGAVRLLLFEGCAKHLDARVALHVERTWAISDSVPIEENQNRRLQAPSELIGRNLFGQVGKKLR